MEGHCGSCAPFPPCLKAYQETWCASMWCGQLAGLKAHNCYLGGTELSPCFEERSKSHIILIKTELFCHHLFLQDVLGLLLTLSVLGELPYNLWSSPTHWRQVLKAGGCGEPCVNKCFCILNFLYTECILNMRVTALWVGSKLPQWYCLCQQG